MKVRLQTEDFDAAAEYTSIPFGGATPGVVNAASMNAGGVARVELIVRARFLRVLCTTAPGNPVTVTVEGAAFVDEVDLDGEPVTISLVRAISAT